MSLSSILLEGVIDHGLTFVASHLQRTLNRPIFITDDTGHIHYPAKTTGVVLRDDLFIVLSTKLQEKEYYYHEKEKSLIYQCGSNKAQAFVIVNNLARDQFTQCLPVIAEAKLAIKTYFVTNTKMRSYAEDLEIMFAKKLFLKRDGHFAKIINKKMNEKDFDIDTRYLVNLLQINANDQTTDLRLLRSHTIEYMKGKNRDVIPIPWDGGCLLLLFPIADDGNKQQSIAADSANWQKALEAKYNIAISAGLGQVYGFWNLHKSYEEARIALTLPQLMGQRGFVQRFCDLGVFANFFSQDVDLLKNYCLETLGRLMEHDQKTEAKLLPTLRILLDNCYNLKATSDTLFIHVNTLHYRITRIEKLLAVDLAKMEVRVNLFIAIKVWDTLMLLGYLNPIPNSSPLFSHTDAATMPLQERQVMQGRS